MAKLSHPYSSFIIFFTFFTLSKSQSQSQRSPSYMGFVSNATEFQSEDYFDYIIVGDGTAGFPLAATLSFGHRVLLLERGGLPHEFPNLMTRTGFSLLSPDIKVVVYANVERVLFAYSPVPSRSDVQTAIGVVIRDGAGSYHHAMLRERGEVILSAGALGSPQTLPPTQQNRLSTHDEHAFWGFLVIVVARKPVDRSTTVGWNSRNDAMRDFEETIR